MTVWFDVSDLIAWKLPQLTGIQRTSANVLVELRAVRSDVRLFAYDYRLGALEEVDTACLPPIVRRHLHDVRLSAPPSPRPKQDTAGTAIVVAPASTPKPRLRLSVRVALGLRQRAIALLGRCKDQEIKVALTDLLRGGEKLLRLLYRRVKPKPAATVASSLPQSRPFAAAAASPECLLFQPGDTCVSLSATWGLPHYGQAIALNKQNGLVKCVNLIYDLIPTLFPEWMPSSVAQMITLWARKQIMNADLVLTISEFQKREIEGYLASDRLPARPVKAIRLGDNPPMMDQVRGGGGLPLPRYVPSRNFILCVSTLDVRKNHHCLYHVWRRLAQNLGEETPQLLLVGVVHHFVAELMHRIRHDRVVNRLIVQLSDITDEELAWYYRNCLFTVYPSMYEGWGLPVAESLALGRYCIAADAASIPEVGGGLVDYFDPLDYVGCYRLVHRAVRDLDYVRQREEQIRASYKHRTWRMTAEQLSRFIDQLPHPSTMAAEQAPAGAVSRRVA